MGYFWATWLADALRKDQFVADRLIEVPGWQTRGRPPEQFSFLPTGILDHHTACLVNQGHDPQSCLNGILAGKVTAPGPVSQLLGTWTPPGVKWNGSNVSPRILVVAAGRSNHAGVGTYPWGAPDGNGSSIGIEWCGPPSEAQSIPWPDEVIELRERVDAAILRHNGWGVHQVTTHWEYATPRGRKIDPSGSYVGQRGLAWNAHWDPETWRQRIAARLNTPPMEEDMIKYESKRLYDSRPGMGFDGVPLSAGEHRGVAVGGNYSGVLVNIQAIPLAGVVKNGNVQAWRSGDVPPDPISGPSVLAFEPGRANSGLAFVGASQGAIGLTASQPCHIIVDLQGTQV